MPRREAVRRACARPHRSPRATAPRRARRGARARTARPRRTRGTRSRRRSAAPARRAARAGCAARRARRAARSRAAPRTRPARRASAETDAPWARRRPRGRIARRAAGRRRSSAASRAGRRGRRRRCRCRARATRWRRARAARPRFRRCSASSRVSLARLPWCAATASLPSRSARWRDARSAMRRVLTKTSVVRCSSASSATRAVDLLPLVVRHHRRERRRRQLEREVALLGVADVDDRAVGDAAAAVHCVGADQEARDLVDRLLRRGKADPREPMRRADRARVLQRERLEPLERQREMAAALACRHRVDLVDDHRAHRREHRAAARRAEQHVERLGRRHQDVRRLAQRLLALVSRRVAGAHRRADLAPRAARGRELGADAGKRRLEVETDVVRERLQRRDVDHHGLVGQALGPEPLAHQTVERGEKRGQRLARARRRGDQRVPAGADLRPGGELRLGRRREGAAEPARRRRDGSRRAGTSRRSGERSPRPGRNLRRSVSASDSQGRRAGRARANAIGLRASKGLCSAAQRPAMPLLLLLLLLSLPLPATATPKAVTVLTIDGAITPASAAYSSRPEAIGRERLEPGRPEARHARRPRHEMRDIIKDDPRVADSGGDVRLAERRARGECRHLHPLCEPHRGDGARHEPWRRDAGADRHRRAGRASPRAPAAERAESGDCGQREVARRRRDRAR